VGTGRPAVVSGYTSAHAFLARAAGDGPTGGGPCLAPAAAVAAGEGGIGGGARCVLAAATAAGEGGIGGGARCVLAAAAAAAAGDGPTTGGPALGADTGTGADAGAGASHASSKPLPPFVVSASPNASPKAALTSTCAPPTSTTTLDIRHRGNGMRWSAR
jgi:hypothetical protein